MKKKAIALMLSAALALGSIGTAPILAAETTAQEAAPVEETTSEKAEDTSEEETAETVEEEPSQEETAETVEEEPAQEETTEIVEEKPAQEETAETVVEESDDSSGSENYEKTVEEEQTQEEASDTHSEAITAPGTTEIVSTDAVMSQVASGTCGNNLTWVLNDKGKLTISGTGNMIDYGTSDKVPWYQSYSKEIISIVVSAGVTSIGDFAFEGCSNLTSVTIPNSVTNIGVWAFGNCSKLPNIKIPNSITSIGNYAFFNCCSLPNVTIPDSVTNIGICAFSKCDSLTVVEIPVSVKSIDSEAFGDCSSLREINVVSDNSNYASEDGVLFNKNKTILMKYPCAKSGSYTIPSSVTSIAGLAFSHCSSLTSVTIPDSVTSMGALVFSQCISLTSVTLGNGLTRIADSTFWFCSNLKSIIVPNSVTSIGNDAFYRCSNLTSVIIGDSVTSIGRDAFRSCEHLIIFTTNEYVIGYAKANKIKYSQYPSYVKELSPKPGAKDVDHSLPIVITFDREIDLDAMKTSKGSAHLFLLGERSPVESIVLDYAYCDTHTDSFTALELDFKNIRSGETYYITIDEGAIPFLNDSTEEDGNTNSGESESNAFPGIANTMWSFKIVDLDYPHFKNPDLSANKDEISEDLFERVFHFPVTAYVYHDQERYRIPNGLCYGMCYLIAASNKNWGIVHHFGELKNYSSYKEKTSGYDEFTISDYLKMANLHQISGEVCEEIENGRDNYDDIIKKIKSGKQIILHIWDQQDKSPKHTDGKGNHAILPIKVVSESDTEIKVLVYDCNGVAFNGELQRTLLNTLTFTKNNDQVTGFKYTDHTGTEYDHMSFNIPDNDFEDLIDGSGYHLVSAVQGIASWSSSRLTNDSYIGVPYYLSDTSVGRADNRDGLFFYWIHGKAIEETIPKGNTIGITDGYDEIEVSADASVNVCLNLEDNSAQIKKIDDVGKDFKIGFGHASNFDMSKKIEIRGEISSDINARKTDEGIMISNAEDTPFEGEVSIIENDKEVQTVDFSATAASIIITYDDNNTVTVTEAKDVKDAEISGISSKTFAGTAIEQDIMVSLEGKKLVDGIDYTAKYDDNTNAGTATVTLIGKGNYTGTKTATFTINPATISNTSVSGLTAKTYTGKSLTHSAVVKSGSVTLKEGTDYTVSYKNNTNAGTATIIFTGKGNYTGTRTSSFAILKAVQNISIKVSAASIAAGRTATVSVTGNVGAKSYKSSLAAVATVNAAGTITAKKVGSTTITATAAATANYNAASKTVSIKVVPAATTSLTAANQATGIKLTWKSVAGATGYKVYRGSTLIKTITSGSTITCTDTTANANGTLYTFKVVPTAPTGSGLARTLAFYRLARPAVSSVKNTAAKKMTVRWKKNAKATGYQIQYSTNKKFASGNKTANITKAATVSKVIGSLTKGKTYYVRIRTYKTVGKAKYWSIWSPAKTVKITK